MENSQDNRTYLNGDGRTDYDEQFSATGCGCYKLFFCCSWRQSNGNEGYLMQQNGESWLGRKFKQVKQASEVIAGPKWKNLIRKLGGYIKGKKQNRNLAMYDSDNYALNFDEGEEEDDDVLLTGFSARYAPLATDERRRSGL